LFKGARRPPIGSREIYPNDGSPFSPGIPACRTTADRRIEPERADPQAKGVIAFVGTIDCGHSSAEVGNWRRWHGTLKVIEPGIGTAMMRRAGSG
jgi:hypothetical protein